MHGYLSNKNSFAYQLAFFEKDFDVHAFDLKGFGENRGMDFPYSLSDYAKEVEEYINEKGLYKPDVIAHSFGGRIAIKLCAENPELLGKVVLTGSAGLKPKRTIKYYSKRLLFKALKPFVKREKLRRFYSSDYLALTPVMRESFKLIVNEHLDGQLKNIQNQIFIVNGELDKETPVYMAKRLNKGIKNSKLLIIKNAGHFCFIDSPLKFNTEVKEFLLSN